MRQTCHSDSFDNIRPLIKTFIMQASQLSHVDIKLRIEYWKQIEYQQSHWFVYFSICERFDLALRFVQMIA